MGQPITSIVVLGGGTAGWMAAAYLRRSLEGVKITVVESPRIGRIGVGEATIPNFKTEVFDYLGIPEEDWLPKADGTYKMGIKYTNWAYPPGDPRGGHFFHHFGECEEVAGVPLFHYWSKRRLEGRIPEGRNGMMDVMCYKATAVMEGHGSPKTRDRKDVFTHAWHMNAELAGDMLRDWAKEHGVVHVQADVEDVELGPDGDVAALHTTDGRKIEAEFFVDCSGLRRIIMSKLGTQWISFKENLINNSALAVGLPHEQDNIGYTPFTSATALNAGWCWRIPLTTRTGNGYVYSNNFTTDDAAKEEFRKYLGVGPDVQFRPIRFDTGRNTHSWVRNCVSFGLASSFIEPLESTTIYFIYAALLIFVRHFPEKQIDPILRNRFNEKVSYMIEDVRDFIVAHFCTTHREDTPYWKACKYDLKISPRLQATIDIYKSGQQFNLTYRGNFDSNFDNLWTQSNFYCIFTGMDLLPQKAYSRLAHMPAAVEEADKRMAAIPGEGAEALRMLPSHQEYVNSFPMAEKMPEKKMM